MLALTTIAWNSASLPSLAAPATEQVRSRAAPTGAAGTARGSIVGVAVALGLAVAGAGIGVALLVDAPATPAAPTSSA
ncbi:hypothetical protein L3i23_03140 [Herbiconiux sp. L3-i23]|nr:hypothetical protein L3i23_03140 [Herbiconiux sp. L3-i23]